MILPVTTALISRVEIHPLPGRGQVDVILEGLLPALTQFARPKPGERIQSGTVLMVARERYRQYSSAVIRIAC